MTVRRPPSERYGERDRFAEPMEGHAMLATAESILNQNLRARDRAAALCSTSIELVARTSATRASIRRSRLASPTRVGLGLAAGSSDAAHSLRDAGDTPRIETRERRCPFCRSHSVQPHVRIVAIDGLLKLDHRCDACGGVFVFVRQLPA
jgi:hypothetical protein